MATRVLAASYVWGSYVISQAIPGLAPTDSIAWWAMLGVGGVLAWGMFQVYRKDMQRNNDLWKGQSEMLVQVVKDNTTAMVALRVGMAQQAQGRRAADNAVAEGFVKDGV